MSERRRSWAGLLCVAAIACAGEQRSRGEGRTVGVQDGGTSTPRAEAGTPSGAGGRANVGAGGDSVAASGGSPPVIDAGSGGTGPDATTCGRGGSSGFLGGAVGTARVDMSTLCNLGEELHCGRSAAQLLEGYVCSVGSTPLVGSPPYVIRKSRTVGCGVETIEWNGGYGGPSQTYSLTTGKLVAASLSSDVNFGPCNASQYVAGEPVAACPDAVEYTCAPQTVLDGGTGVAGCRAPTDPGCAKCCIQDFNPTWCFLRSGDAYALTSSSGALCDPSCAPCAACTIVDEQALAALPPRPDCDCTIDPGIDPCLASDSCGCWCGSFVELARKCAGVAF